MSANEELRCCECKFFVGWNQDEEQEEEVFTCQECSHEWCENCGQWRDSCQSTSLTKSSDCDLDCLDCKLYDPKDGEVFEEDSEGDSDNESELYYHKDTEGEKHASIPLNQLLEPGPKADDLVVLSATPESRHTARQLSPQLLIPIYISYFAKFLTESRAIRVIPKAPDVWTYRSFLVPNQIPFIIYGLDGLMKSHAKKYLKAAPRLGSEVPYPYYNYEVDLLWFDFQSCGNTAEAFKDYVAAMHSAADYLRSHNIEHTENKIKTIKITYCNHAEFVYHPLNPFRGISGLQHVILAAHSHWDHVNNDILQDELRKKDLGQMNHCVRMGYLEGGLSEYGKYKKYGFKAQLFDADGDQVDGTFHDTDTEESESTGDETIDTSFGSANVAVVQEEETSELEDDKDDVEEEDGDNYGN